MDGSQLVLKLREAVQLCTSGSCSTKSSSPGEVGVNGNLLTYVVTVEVLGSSPSVDRKRLLHELDAQEHRGGQITGSLEGTRFALNLLLKSTAE